MPATANPDRTVGANGHDSASGTAVNRNAGTAPIRPDVFYSGDCRSRTCCEAGLATNDWFNPQLRKLQNHRLFTIHVSASADLYMNATTLAAMTVASTMPVRPPTRYR